MIRTSVGDVRSQSALRRDGTRRDTIDKKQFTRSDNVEL